MDCSLHLPELLKQQILCVVRNYRPKSKQKQSLLNLEHRSCFITDCYILFLFSPLYIHECKMAEKRKSKSLCMIRTPHHQDILFLDAACSLESTQLMQIRRPRLAISEVIPSSSKASSYYFV